MVTMWRNLDSNFAALAASSQPTMAPKRRAWLDTVVSGKSRVMSRCRRTWVGQVRGSRNLTASKSAALTRYSWTPGCTTSVNETAPLVSTFSPMRKTPGASIPCTSPASMKTEYPDQLPSGGPYTLSDVAVSVWDRWMRRGVGCCGWEEGAACRSRARGRGAGSERCRVMRRLGVAAGVGVGRGRVWIWLSRVRLDCCVISITLSYIAIICYLF